MTTCQICGRAIKAVPGLIAHHGYRRPHEGWQTRSCLGARRRPYEVACDAIAPAIQHATIVRDNMAFAHLELFYFPQLQFDVTRRDAYGVRGPVQLADRPVGFDPFTVSLYGNQRGTYARAWVDRELQLRRELREIDEHIAYLRDRLAKWVAPTTLSKIKLALNAKELQALMPRCETAEEHAALCQREAELVAAAERR
jgi:hypothetical protein